jgi:multidrug efflux pump subunit AcrA (membrane-fusion protein)
VPVIKGDIVQLKVFEGTVTARSESLRFIAADAVVGEVYCSPGDYVTKGTLLAAMDKSGLNAQIEMYKSMLEFNEATWINSNIQSEIAIARTKEYGSVALAEEQQKRLDFDRQSQQIEQERLNFKINTLIAREPEYEITAPFDGTVIHIEALAPGNFIAPRGVFIWIADMTDLSIQCYDSAMRDAMLSAKRVTADFGTGEQPIETVPYTSQELLAFSLENKTPPSRFRVTGGELSAENRVLLRVYGDTRQEVLTLIPNAVHDDTVTTDGVTSHNRFVYIDENGAAVRREVKLGLTSDIAVEILDGLQEGDKVYVQEN